MKKILVLAVAALGFAFNASAQKSTTPTKEVVAQKSNTELSIEKNATLVTQKVDKLVGGLSKEQQDRIQEVNVSMERRKQIVSASTDPSKDKVLKQIETIRTKMYLEILQGKQAERYQSSLSK